MRTAEPGGPVFRLSASQRILRRDVERRLSTVTQILSYIDTLQILARRIPPGWLDRLRASGAGSVFGPERPKNGPWLLFRVHQPTRRTFVLVAALGMSNYRLNRVDLAFDFMVPTAQGLREFRRFLERHLTQPWRGTRKQCRFEGTLYFGSSWSRRNIAIYSDRPSKITGQPCVHIELRYCRSGSCSRIGLDTADGICALDPVRIADRGFRVSAVSTANLRREILKVARATYYDRRRHERNLSFSDAEALADSWYFRVLQTGEPSRSPKWFDDIPVQEYLDVMPGIVRPLLVHLPGSILIKCAQFRIQP